MFHDCRPNTRGTAVEQQWNIVVQVPRFGRPGFEPVTLEKSAQECAQTGIRTQTTSKNFCNMADSNLGKTQKVVWPGFELVASRKACHMAGRAPGLHCWVYVPMFHANNRPWNSRGTGRGTLVDQVPGSALFHGCSTAVPRESTLQSGNIVDCPDSWNSGGTSWTEQPQTFAPRRCPIAAIEPCASPRVRCYATNFPLLAALRRSVPRSRRCGPRRAGRWRRGW